MRIEEEMVPKKEGLLSISSRYDGIAPINGMASYRPRRICVRRPEEGREGGTLALKVETALCRRRACARPQSAL